MLEKYAWEAAGWFWKHGNPQNTDLNTYADDKDWDYISSRINENDRASFKLRNKYINKFYEILTGEKLGNQLIY